MAAMARVLKIPSRVAVGFLPGERRGDTFEVSIRDMHAWPELYFAGYGWVRFEPTPSGVTGTAPSWTSRPTTHRRHPPDAPSDLPSAADPSASAAPSAAPSEPPIDGAAGTGFDWVRTLIMTAIGLLVLVILAAPATIRVRRRNTRLNAEGEPAEQVESAWAEIRDTVVDHGGSWPGGSRAQSAPRSANGSTSPNRPAWVRSRRWSNGPATPVRSSWTKPAPICRP